MTSLQLLPAIYSTEDPAGKGFLYSKIPHRAADRAEGAKGQSHVRMPWSQYQKNIQ